MYLGVEGVEMWPARRDARGYEGPWPVIAHPPCARWCRFAGLVESRNGHRRGDDAGCFAAAVRAVRRWGGVLEHPAWSAAWAAFDLPRPPENYVGWQRGLCGGWAAYVEQGRYGAPVRKATWLYVVGAVPPSLRWGRVDDGERGAVAWRGQLSNRRKRTRDEDRPVLGKGAASRTPPEFRDVLLAIARSVPSQAAAAA